MLTFYAFRECRVSHAVVWARRPEQQTMLSAVRCFLKFALNRASYIHTNTRKTTLGWKMMRPKRLLLYIRTPPPHNCIFHLFEPLFFLFSPEDGILLLLHPYSVGMEIALGRHKSSLPLYGFDSSKNAKERNTDVTIFC